jgi:hypothetical protein
MNPVTNALLKALAAPNKLLFSEEVVWPGKGAVSSGESQNPRMLKRFDRGGFWAKPFATEDWKES